MRVLVTGAKGQLGRDVVRSFSESHVLFGFGHDDLDITDEIKVKCVVEEIRPDVIMHCAAYTAVDKAEDDQCQAYAVNVQGTKNIVAAANNIGAKLCAISTDYVFDGKADAPYEIDSQPNPQTMYGRSKLAAENLIRELMDEYFIVRTSWVFGPYGKNFVKSMLNIAKSGQPIKVVDDQTGSPTYTKHLCIFLLSLVQSDRYGLYHVSNTGACSWYEFAREIFAQASLEVKLSPCPTTEFPRPAQRPKYSVMSQRILQENGFELLPPWQEALREYLSELSDDDTMG